MIFLSDGDCAYVRKLLGLFESEDGDNDAPGNDVVSGGGGGQSRQGTENDQENVAELATVIKSILLLNDPEIIEYVTTHPPTFESICAVMEHDPELRERANHLDFLRTKARFRTVVPMEDEELVSNIHRLFRVNYMRDVMLRPTMDEGSLSALFSLAQFIMSGLIEVSLSSFIYFCCICFPLCVALCPLRRTSPFCADEAGSELFGGQGWRRTFWRERPDVKFMADETGGGHFG